MERDSMLFYRSFYEAIVDLPKEIQLEVYTAIMEYGLNGELPENLKPVTKAMFALMKPVIDSNTSRYNNGRRGGRPRNSAKASAPPYNLTIDQEVERLRADTQWAETIRSQFSLTESEYSRQLDLFHKHCRGKRGGGAHESYDDACNHFRYWLEKTNTSPGRKSKPPKSDADYIRAIDDRRAAKAKAKSNEAPPCTPAEWLASKGAPDGASASEIIISNSKKTTS